jgi:hypothetical protein
MSSPDYRVESSLFLRVLARRAALLGTAGLLVVLSVLPAAAGQDGCPSPEQMAAQLQRLDLKRASRTAKFEMPVPTGLYEKACKQIGKSFTSRDGDKGEGVIVAEVPIAAVWKALNDENRHADEGSPIPVEYSEVIEGTPRGQSRLIFQWAKKFGFGRWWVSRVRMNGELYKESEGRLWELQWEGKSDEVDPEAPPMNSVSSDLKPVKMSVGAWLLVSLGESCTLVEYFNWSDPGGGMVGFTQPMVFKKGLRQTSAGVVELAEKYRVNAPSGPAFVLPDGTPLD